MRYSVFSFDVVTVIGRNQLYPEFFRETGHPFQNKRIVGHFMVLYLKIEVISEYLMILLRHIFRCGVIPPANIVRDNPAETGGSADKPLRILLQKLKIYSRFIIISLQKSAG